ncbi:MAG: primosomal protein N' [Oscillospiraceae bacterium]|nr:primosomal protein N' [Oscillospiraceae bacterium]
MNNQNLTHGLIALVAVEAALYSFDRLYSYAVPFEADGVDLVGKRVLVPFGRGSRKIVGVVFDVAVRDYDGGTVKSIAEVLDSEAFLDREMLDLAAWLKENTFCTYYHAVRCILPPIIRDLGGLDKLGTSDKNKSERIIRLPDDFEPPENMTPKQKSVIEVLETQSASIKELCYLCAVGAGVVTNLVKKGILTEEIAATLPSESEAAIPVKSVDDIVLTESQNGVFRGLLDLVKTGEAKCALLHGITGSGKTSVFIKTVGEVLRSGRSAMILVPEISLTPQTIAIFKGFFGETSAVIHSGLTAKTRGNEYKRIRDGDAKIVIGTRSAVFAPLKNIGIIVIDEEGEHTYKSERSPRFHVRDVAKQRCFRHKSLLLLASATPSMDSYRRAQIGKYSLFELSERYSGSRLPDVHIIDMKLERAMGNTGNFSEDLLSQLRLGLERGEQSLILLNRRGYYTFMNCAVCGEVAMCPNCGIALTFHSTGTGSLRCHYCNYLKQNSHSCEKCGGGMFRQSGTGTQRVEDELGELIPNARILRMDADTTMTKGAYERNFGLFKDREYDIMVGTQMIAKGLDFPNVTLVGILLIDNSLYAGDYVGYERTFSLITQVVGRGGRGDKKGRAYLQTFTPEHYVLRLAASQDYRRFYEEEAAIRRTLLFPPFCDLCVAEVCDVKINEPQVAGAAFAFAEIFGNQLRKITESRAVGDIPVRVLGPVKHGVGSVNGRVRYRLIFKCRNSPIFREVMRESLIAASIDKRFNGCKVSAWRDN